MIWNTYPMNDDIQYRVDIGHLSIIIKKQACDWFIAHQYHDTPFAAASITGEKTSADDDPSLQSFQWQRWMTGCSFNSFRLSPVFPERPLIIYPDMVTRIPQNSVSTFFVKIPVWISVIINKDESIVLCELPSMLLSNSWAGDTITGELCYSLNTGMAKNYYGLNASDYQAICQVTLENNSKSDFGFERYTLHVEYLSILQGKKFLWSNPVEITFLGEDQHSKIHFSDKYPSVEEIEKKFGEPRKKIEKNIVMKTFRFFKTLTDF